MFSHCGIKTGNFLYEVDITNMPLLHTRPLSCRLLTFWLTAELAVFCVAVDTSKC